MIKVPLARSFTFFRGRRCLVGGIELTCDDFIKLIGQGGSQLVLKLSFTGEIPAEFQKHRLRVDVDFSDESLTFSVNLVS